MRTRFTDLVGCSLPIQQAGMGGVSVPALAMAVSRAGGLGMLALSPSPLEERLATMREARCGPFGVNFLMPWVDVSDVEQAAAQSRLVEFFYADPDPALVARVHGGGALAAWQVGSADEARAAVDAGCDLVIAQGVEAGGHVRGTTPLLALLDQVLGAVAVPVVAAGGLATARGVAAVLAAGADAARVGTRFVATDEADAHPAYVEALLRAGGADTVLTTAFSTGWPDAPHRVLRSCVEAADAFGGDVVGTMRVGGEVQDVPRYFVSPPARDAAGAVEAMALYAGMGVGSVTAVRPAAEVVAELAEGAMRLLGEAAPS